jgi:tripartite-type tricarboxylate transporter receptor subunit TctC
MSSRKSRPFAMPMRLLRVVVVGALAIWSAGALAQTDADVAAFPTRPIKLIVPFPAGGGTDILSRLIGQKMSERWGQPVVIENRPGGNTAIGAQAAARSAPDGYTLLAAMDVTMVMNSASGAPMSYDPVNDFSPVTLLAKNGALLGVRAADGVRSIPELIAKGKGISSSLNYGAGVTITRLGGYMFTKAAGFQAVMIPYKGSAETLQGLLSGSVDFVIDGVGTMLPLVKSGSIRALAKLDARPLSSLPDVPTLATAANLPQLEDVTAWTGLYVPAGTPPAITDKLQREVARIFSDPIVGERLAALEISAVTSTPSELGNFHRRELVRWKQVFKENRLDF